MALSIPQLSMNCIGRASQYYQRTVPLQVSDNTCLNMSSYADILFNAIGGLITPVGIINFPATGGIREMDNPHVFFRQAIRLHFY